MASCAPLAQPAGPALAESLASHVVLIEDDKYIGAAVSLYLTRKGYAVEHFLCALQARAWLDQNVCDLVITDIFMPDSDGLEIIQWLRKRHPGLRVIAISGSDYYGNSYLKTARLMGATRVLAKPFELAELSELVGDVLRPLSSEIG